VENIFEALPVEQTLDELQQHRAERLARSAGPSEVSTADLHSAPPSTIDNGDEKSLASESFVHASQMAESTADGLDKKLTPSPLRPKRNKAQLWNQVKIDCMSLLPLDKVLTDFDSNISRLHTDLYALPPYPSHTNPTQPTRTTELPRQCGLSSVATSHRLQDQLGEPRR